MKNRSLKAGGRLNRWSLKAGFTVLVDRTCDTVTIKQSQRRVTSPTSKMFRQHLKCSLTAPRRAGTSFGSFLFLFTQPAVWAWETWYSVVWASQSTCYRHDLRVSGCHDTSPAVDCCSFSICRTQSPEELGRVGERSLRSGWTARLSCGDTDFFFFF